MKSVEKVWATILRQTGTLVWQQTQRFKARKNYPSVPATTSKTQDNAAPNLPYPHFYPQAKHSIFGRPDANPVHNRDGDIFVNNHGKKFNNRYKTHSPT